MRIKTVILVLVVFASCKTRNISRGTIKSYHKQSRDVYHFNGSVKTSRTFQKLYNRDSLSDDQLQLFLVANRFVGFCYGVYIEFDKNGTEKKWHSIPDSMYQSLAHDTIVVKSKRGRMVRMYAYEHFSKDIEEKTKYRQEHLVRKHVFNPYRVYFNTRSYEPNEVIVEKDSSYRKQTEVYEYTLNYDGTIHQEIGKTHWDKDLDNEIDKETINFTATYHYNTKKQLIKKTFEFGGFPDYPDHGLEFWGTGKIPQEEYTYDERGNLTSVYTYTVWKGERVGLVFSEDFTYDDSNNLIRLKRRASGGLSFNTDFKRVNELYFNENQEVIKLVSYENDEKTVHATYKFEYVNRDKYNNWLTYYHYLNDEEKAFSEVHRVFEYYDSKD